MVIPSTRSRKLPITYDQRCFNKFKHFRRFATRYDRRAIHYLAFIHLAAIILMAATNVDSS